MSKRRYIIGFTIEADGSVEHDKKSRTLFGMIVSVGASDFAVLDRQAVIEAAFEAPSKAA